MTDIRVIYLSHPSHGVRAPELMVRFRCPKCHGEEVLDANRGVPVCGVDRVALIGVSVVVGEGFDPFPAGMPTLTRAVETQGEDRGGRPAESVPDAEFFAQWEGWPEPRDGVELIHNAQCKNCGRYLEEHDLDSPIGCDNFELLR